MFVAQVKLRLPLLSLLILQLILVNIRTVENEKDDIDNGGVKKRIPKCSGCKVKFEDHGCENLDHTVKGIVQELERKVK